MEKNLKLNTLIIFVFVVNIIVSIYYGKIITDKLDHLENANVAVRLSDSINEDMYGGIYLDEADNIVICIPDSEPVSMYCEYQVDTLIGKNKVPVVYRHVKYSIAQLKDFANIVKKEDLNIDYVAIDLLENKLQIFYREYDEDMEFRLQEIIPEDSFYLNIGPYDIPVKQ